MKSFTRFNLISIFLVILIVVPCVSSNTPVTSQTRERPTFFCNYIEGTRGAELCSRLQSDNFASKEHAERVVDMIVRPLGLRRNFTLVPCPNINNAAAVTYEDGVRYIVYDNAFMDSIDVSSNTNWASVSIVAHEVGHHLQGHTLRRVSLEQRRENELEADEFSGSALFKMGASLYQAQAAIRNSPDVDDEETSTHPKKWRRLEAIKRGYENAKSQGAPPSDEPAPTLVLQVDLRINVNGQLNTITIIPAVGLALSIGEFTMNRQGDNQTFSLARGKGAEINLYGQNNLVYISSEVRNRVKVNHYGQNNRVIIK